MDVQSESLSLFQPPPVERTIQKQEWVEYKPIGQITEQSVIEFNLPGTTQDYIDLKKTRLCVSLKIQTSEGKAVAETNLVALANLSLHSIFRQVDLTLQQKVISANVGTSYPYKAIFDVLLNTDRQTQRSQMQSQLFFKDTASAMDATDILKGGNVGLVERFIYTDDGGIVDLEGPLYVDICQQPRAILNSVPIGLRLYPNTNAFGLITAEEDKYKVIITDAKLKVCHVRIQPEIAIAHNEALKIGPALYPIVQSDIKTYGIAKGSYDFCVDGLYGGEIPSSIVIALVESEAYSGSYTKNFSNFQTFNLNYLDYTIDGNSTPMKPFQPDYKKGRYMSEFLSIFPNRDNNNTSLNIDEGDYPNGYAIYVFDIAQTQGDVIQPERRGHSRISIKFAEALDKAVTLIVYSKFPKVVKIDQTRTVILP